MIIVNSPNHWCYIYCYHWCHMQLTNPSLSLSLSHSLYRCMADQEVNYQGTALY